MRTSSVQQDQIWVIIPAFNEQEHISSVITSALSVTSHLLVVDDGSRDNTAAIARKKIPFVLRHVVNLGKGAALKTGCEFAFNKLQAKAVVFMDSDNQHNPQELSAFFSALCEGHQAVFGVRTLKNAMPLLRAILNQFASVLVAILFGSYIPDIPCGYKAFTKKAYEALRWQATDYAVELELAVRTAAKKIDFTTVPVSTIYLSFDRGMTFIDVLYMSLKILSWRIVL